MLVDANVLLFAVDAHSPFHPRASQWLSDRLNGDRRIGLPWSSLAAFLRISTHSRASANPLTAAAAWKHVEDWLACPAAWIPAPADQYVEILGRLIVKYDLRGNLISDGLVAALAIEHGLTVCSADTDFARFEEIDWIDPFSAAEP